MEHTVDTVEGELLLGEVDPADVEAARVLLFLRWVVIVREAIDADAVVAVLLQCRCDPRADKTGGSRDDLPHRGNLPSTFPQPPAPRRTHTATTTHDHPPSTTTHGTHNCGAAV